MTDNCKSTLISPYAVLSELLSTVYNLSTLFKNLNDAAEHENETKLSTSDNIKKWLTILEYCETCLELAALSIPRNKNQMGNRLKWTVVSLVQLAKCAGRMVLLLKYNQGLLPYPPLAVKNSPIGKIHPEVESYNYTLKSGRRIRSVRPVYIQTNTETENVGIGKEMKDMELLAEAAYICKPIVHLGALYFSNNKSWKPWLLSLIIDITSLAIFDNVSTKNEFSNNQKRQLLNRQIALITYLLRSPFYDKNTKRFLEIILYSLEMFIPCTSRFLVQPLLAHLPLLQQIYFYFWSH